MIPTYNGSQCTGACDEGCSHAERFDERQGIRRLEVKHDRGERMFEAYSLTKNGVSAEDVMAEQAEAEAKWGEERVSADQE